MFKIIKIVLSFLVLMSSVSSNFIVNAQDTYVYQDLDILQPDDIIIDN